MIVQKLPNQNTSNNSVFPKDVRKFESIKKDEQTTLLCYGTKRSQESNAVPSDLSIVTHSCFLSVGSLKADGSLKKTIIRAVVVIIKIKIQVANIHLNSIKSRLRKKFVLLFQQKRNSFKMAKKRRTTSSLLDLPSDDSFINTSVFNQNQEGQGRFDD